MMKQYTRGEPSGRQSRDRASDAQGYVLRDAPWSPSAEDFPAMATATTYNATATGSKKPAPQWGPSAYGPKIPKGI